MKTENKGGRPVKIAGQKKGYCVCVKMDTLEYYTLKAKAREASISISENDLHRFIQRQQSLLCTE